MLVGARGPPSSNSRSKWFLRASKALQSLQVRQELLSCVLNIHGVFVDTHIHSRACIPYCQLHPHIMRATDPAPWPNDGFTAWSA